MGPFWSILFVQMTLFYMFGLVGLFIYGGKITTLNPEILNDDSTPDLYYLCNFNDLANGFLTLFELMVVNNWHVISQMYIDISGT